METANSEMPASAGAAAANESTHQTSSPIPAEPVVPAAAAAPDLPLSSFGLPRLFSRVVINLENCLIPEDRLANPPSLCEGMDLFTERQLRLLGCELIQAASILLRL